MTSKEEIEILAKRIFGDNLSSIWQINKATIRIELKDKTFIDIFQSLKGEGKFALHAKLADKKIFRVDCRPERKYKKLKTFPWHFHRGSEEKVVSSPFSANKKTAIMEFLKFINKILSTPKP